MGGSSPKMGKSWWWRPCDWMVIAYREGPEAFLPADFIALAQQIWPRAYDPQRIAEALARTLNVGAWTDTRLVGSVRILSDGYLLSTIPEIMVAPDLQRQGIGRELMRRALLLAPGGAVFFGAQPGREGFFERIGFVRGPVGFVWRATSYHPEPGR